MHNKIAVDAVIGSSSRISAGDRKQRRDRVRRKAHDRKADVAFQKPMTVHGSVSANSATQDTIGDAEAAGGEGEAGEAKHGRHGER